MDPHQVQAAWQRACDELIRRRESAGYWRGRLCSSPLATATAISALIVYSRSLKGKGGSFPPTIEEAIPSGLKYLLATQRPDGGWGDTERSLSNIATTYLVCAAIELAGKAIVPEDTLRRAEQYIERQGSENGLRRRYGRDQTFVAPILTNMALAQLCSWESVPQLPFELAAFPQSLYRFLGLPVVSYAIPALVAIGLARFQLGPKSNGILGGLRHLVTPRCLKVVATMQPASGGFLEAVPLTAFVTMSFSAIGLPKHPIVQKAVRFLLSLQRSDGSWPVDVDLATWVTTLATNALAAGDYPDWVNAISLDWILNCQHLDFHPFTGADPGGWGWTDHSGSVPDADDTSGALLALANFCQKADTATRRKILPSALLGLDWLVHLQNRDGGWPTFCRGWGTLPFDQSAVDLTAHAIRALQVWYNLLTSQLPTDLAVGRIGPNGRWPEAAARRLRRLENVGHAFLRSLSRAISKGMAFLRQKQDSDGRWLPLWFGNERLPDEENPIYGTSRCLLGYTALNRGHDPAAKRAVNWLLQAQNRDGSWGRSACEVRQEESGHHDRANADKPGSIEETSLAISALAGFGDHPAVSAALDRGLSWLIRNIEDGSWHCATPIGLYFARLWYYEDLYPIVFATEALGRYLQRRKQQQET